MDCQFSRLVTLRTLALGLIRALPLVILATSSWLVPAQVITSSITGFVTDSSGAVVADTRVTLLQEESGFTRAVRSTIVSPSQTIPRR